MKRLVLALAIIAGTAFVSVPANADGDDTTESTTSSTTDTGGETQLAEPTEPEQELVLDPVQDDVVVQESAPPAKKPAAEAPAAKKSSESTELAAAKDDVTAAADEEGNVKICHATVSESNPYVLPPPSTSGDGEGHLSHSLDENGDPLPIWYPGAKDDGVTWGDIIQPLPGVEGLEDGLNWDNGGQQVAENGCEIPTGPATAPTVTAPACGVAGTLVIPDDNPALQYTVTPTYTPGDTGTFTITVVAIGPFIITGPTSWTLTVNGALQCATPLAPSVNPPTCSAPGSIVTTPVTGIEYQISPTFNGAGDYTVTAVPTAGYQITPDAQTSWNVTVLPQLNCVTPLEPTVDPPTCDADGAIDFTEVTGVTYTVSPEFDGAGTYTVTATADTGYVFNQGVQTVWTDIVVEEQLNCVSPVEPGAIDPTCEDAGNVDLPTTEGVVYTLVSIIDGVATVEATPADGYHFEDGVDNPTVYEIEVDEQLNCVLPVTGVVTPGTCETAGDFQPVETEGVVYTRTDNGDGTVTITAEAAEGYVLFDDAVTSWTETLDEQLPEGECVEPRVVEDPPKEAPKLPNTGAPSMAYLWFGFLMTAAGGYLVSRRRQEI